MLKKISPLILCSISALIAESAYAADTANVTVSLTVTAGCQIFVGAASAAAGTASLDFGNTVTYGSGLSSTSSIQGSTGSSTLGSTNTIGVSCGSADTALAPALVLTSASNDADDLHYMASGSNKIAYTLYSSSARDTAIATGGSIALTSDSSVTRGSGWTATLYGTVTSPTAISAAGSYSDTLLLTLSY